MVHMRAAKSSIRAEPRAWEAGCLWEERSRTSAGQSRCWVIASTLLQPGLLSEGCVLGVNGQSGRELLQGWATLLCSPSTCCLTPCGPDAFPGQLFGLSSPQEESLSSSETAGFVG